MLQVAKEFKKKKTELGAKRAAKELGVCLASFYKYVAGTDLPRPEILKKAHAKWAIQWAYIDPGSILRSRKVNSTEQLVLAFLETLREEDVEVSQVIPARRGPQKENSLQITLKIRFTA